MSLKHTLRKLESSVIHYPRIKQPIVYMTLLVKNEEEVLEQNILFHKKMGVDGFIITDNGSTDKTAQIIDKYKKLGWIKESKYSDMSGYPQAMFVNQMISTARDKYKADWVINADADEFWCCKNGLTYKDIFSGSYHNVLSFEVNNMYPIEDTFWRSCYRIKNDIDLTNYDLPKYNLFSPQFNKVAHRAKGYKMISAGNHNVKIGLKSIGDSADILIYHYNVRSKKHFYNKFILGGKNALNTPNIAEHWKYFYRLSQSSDFDLDDTYNAYIGKNYFEDMLNNGFIVYDDTVKEIIDEIQYTRTQG